jgi:energy-coupling factor transporter transmembrane protein EcfT
MSYLAIALFLMQEYKFLSVALLCAIGIIAGSYFLKQPLRRILPWSLVLFLLLFLINMLFGFTLRNWLITKSGVQGEGVITQVTTTSMLYNHRPILQFDVTLRGQQGELLNTRFYSDAFNVVHGDDWSRTNYPSAGEKFNTLYIPAYPKAFVILTDTKSEYGQRLQKNTQLTRFTELTSQLKMDPTNTNLQAQLDNLTQQNENLRTIAQGQTTLARLQEYQALLEQLKSSPEDAAAITRIEELAKQEDAIGRLWQLAKAKRLTSKVVE